MSTKTFFLKNIRSEGYRDSLSAEDQASLDKYLEVMKKGPADGEVDIEWQETGKGYYVHLHQLESLLEGQERDEYLNCLEEDMKLWLTEDPSNYMVCNVREIIGKEII